MLPDELRIKRSALRATVGHCVAGYPQEQCGLLIGGANEIDEVRPVRNVWTDVAERHRRFLLDPAEQLRVERSLDGSGRAVLGSFHSHPDHPAEPSAFDAETAWPGYVYLIVPVHAGLAGAPRAWRPDASTGRFVEVTIAVDPL